jgi:hypothetical protein
MDPLIATAARALAAGDPLGALKRVGVRDDAPALALRGIAMAQLGELAKAKALLRSAARAFGPGESIARARCIVAEAEVAFAARDLSWPAKTLDGARAVLEKSGDAANAAHARYLEIRRLLLLGRMDQAERALAALDPALLPPALRTAHELGVAGIAMRRLRAKDARAALANATRAANAAGIPALMAEVESAARMLNAPAARLIAGGEERPLRLDDVETLLASKALIVDACRYAIRQGGKAVSLATRPVLFALAERLAQTWPADVPRDVLVARVFGFRRMDETHRARLRVEMGRLRKLLKGFADVRATAHGFALEPSGRAEAVVLAQPVDEEHAAVLALLSDGESWSSSALGLALGTSQRSVQRALDALAAEAKVRSVGRGRARRWMTPPVPGFTTTLLLPAPLPDG